MLPPESDMSMDVRLSSKEKLSVVGGYNCTRCSTYDFSRASRASNEQILELCLSL